MYQIDYLEALIPGERRRILEWSINALKGYHFDTIVVRGVSGLIIGAPLADRLDCGLTVVRKGASHSIKDVEGMTCCSGVIVDDFIDSGRTIDKILAAVPSISIQLILLYADTASHPLSHSGILVVSR